MLEWCRNLQANQPPPHEYTSTTSHPEGKRIRKLQPHSSRHPIPSLPKDNERRGIKTHFNRSLKEHKHTQTSLEVGVKKQLIDISTQTLQVMHNPVLVHHNHIIYTPRNLPSHLLLHQHPKPHLNHLPYESNLFNTLHNMHPRQNQYKNDQRRQTKASYNLIQSQQPLSSTHKTSEFIFKNAESIHVSPSKNTHHRHQAIAKSKLPHKLYTFCIEESDSIKSPIKSEKPFSQKYKDMLRNVESELKNYEKKHSQKKFKPIPQPRIVLFDRKTIISKHNDSNRQSQKQIAIEQSFVIEPSIRELFVPLKKHAYEHYSVSIWEQMRTGMLVSCKQVPIASMSEISAELLVYKQLQCRNIRIQSIIQLYQSQIDNQNYIFIKEPFTHTLLDHLHNNPSFLHQALTTLFRQIEQYGVYLRVEPKLQDLVVCFNEIKILNVQILQFEEEGSLSVQYALSSLIQKIQS